MQQIEELTTTLGSVDLSSVKNMEDPKVVERVNDWIACGADAIPGDPPCQHADHDGVAMCHVDHKVRKKKANEFKF